MPESIRPDCEIRKADVAGPCHPPVCSGRQPGVRGPSSPASNARSVVRRPDVLSDGAVHALHQPNEVKGLCDEIVGAGGKSIVDIAGVGSTGEDDDRETGCFGPSSQAPADLEAIHVAQTDVEKDHPEAFVGRIQGRLARRDRRHIPAVPGENER